MEMQDKKMYTVMFIKKDRDQWHNELVGNGKEYKATWHSDYGPTVPSYFTMDKNFLIRNGHKHGFNVATWCCLVVSAHTRPRGIRRVRKL